MLASLSEEDQAFVLSIYNNYGKYMYKIAKSILQNEHDAEDAVQDAMVKIIKYISKFEGKNADKIRSQVVIYIRSIITNKSIDLLNKNNTRKQHTANLQFRSNDTEEFKEINIDDPTADTEDIVITKTGLEAAMAVIREFPPHLRDSVNLVLIHGYSYSEAADVLGITEGTLRERISQARKIIREKVRGK